MKHSQPFVPSSVSVLEPFARAGVFDAAEIHLADALIRHVTSSDPVADDVILGIALAALGRRLGHVCVVLDDAPELCRTATAGRTPREAALPALDPSALRASLAASPLVTNADDSTAPTATDELRPLVLDGGRLYLQRYHDHETVVLERLLERVGRTDGSPEPEETATAIAEDATAQQRAAIHAAAVRPATFLLGGPGTGKTWTIAQLMRLVSQRSDDHQPAAGIALAAPTGKAASRLTQAVTAVLPGAPEATTLHRLLGWLPGGAFRHDRHHRLPHDLIVVDETSMVDLPMMRRLLDALRPDARVVFVGDPDQLVSVEVGSALRDLVTPASGHQDGPLSPSIFVLDRVHRFEETSGIATLAAEVRNGDGDRVIEVLQAGAGVRWVDPADAQELAALRDEVATAAIEVATAARDGDARLGLDVASRLKVLTATRRGAHSLADWNDRLSARAGVDDRFDRLHTVGRPILVTANDRLNRVVNGDVGLVVAGPDGPVVALLDGADIRQVSPSRLRDVETWWAMTIHKSQGSEFDHAVVSLPDEPSPVLSRELLYTGITRAKRQLTLVASEAVVRDAVAHRVARASGLTDRLRRAHGTFDHVDP